MYIFKNALKSITRSKGRNVLIGVIILIIAISSCISLSIKNAAAEIVTGYEDSFEITATIGIDRLALREISQTQGTDMRTLMSTIVSPDADTIALYGDSEYLDDYSYTITASLNSEAIVPLTNDEIPSNDTSGQGDRMPGGDATQGILNVRGDFSLVGYSSYRAMTSFIDGTYQITSGEMFPADTQDLLCVISDELALENELEVGDVILMTNPQNEEQIFSFTISGVYTDQTVEDASSMSWFSNSANQILTSYAAVDAIASQNEDFQTQLTSVFYLNNNEVVDAFKTELRTKGLDEMYAITTNESSFDATVKPLSNLNQFATIFLVLVLVIGGIILLVLNMINIRERKYEVGVLRAIGMKKGKLVMQFATELLIVSFVAIIAGSAIGAVASVPAANMMLQNEIESVQSESNQIDQNFGGPGGSFQPGGGGGMGRDRIIMGGVFDANQDVDYVSQINAVINLQVLAQLMLIGILLTVFSSIISVVLVSRYEPLKILSERS